MSKTQDSIWDCNFLQKDLSVGSEPLVEATVGFVGIDCLSCDKFGTFLLLSALTNFNCGVSTPLLPWQAINGTGREGGGFGLGGCGGLSLKEHCGGDHLTVFPASKVDLMVCGTLIFCPPSPVSVNFMHYYLRNFFRPLPNSVRTSLEVFAFLVRNFRHFCSLDCLTGKLEMCWAKSENQVRCADVDYGFGKAEK